VNTGHEQAHHEQGERDGTTTGEGFDVMTTFFHDVPPDAVAEAMARGERRLSVTSFQTPWPLAAWPDMPTRFLLCHNEAYGREITT
jgi:hypothetical protein